MTEWDNDPVLETAFDELSEFYDEIQMFCSSPAEREKERALFDIDHLKDRTHLAYVALKGKWQGALETLARSRQRP